MKRKTAKKMISYIFAAMLLFAGNMTSLAKSADVAILANMTWTSDSDHTDSRSGQYSTVYARCYSVYPDSGTDTFQQIRCRVTNGYGSVISSEVTLKETASSNTAITIKEGYLSTRFVGFQFRGNTNASANSSVYYNGR